MTATAATVGTTAAELVPARATRKSVTILNVDATSTDHVYLGTDANVTTSNGFRIAPSESYKFNDYNGPVWAIATSASTPTRIMEAY